MLSLYWQCKNLNALPESGGVLDMRADHFAYFGIFAEAESIWRAQEG